MDRLNLPALEITLLGVPRILLANRSLDLPRRQTRALLYRLAADGSPVSRAHLCFLFWPDTPDPIARRNLTRLLVLLRGALPSAEYLLADDDSIGLNPAQTACDTVEFLRLTRTVDAATRRAALEQAAQRVRGPFLEGFALPDAPEFELWIDQERQVWERRTRDVLAALIEAHTASRNYGAAIAVAQRLLQFDELAEEVHRRLISLYAATGDRSAALRQYERCAVLLERELGVSPLPETHAAYVAARDGTAGSLSILAMEAATRETAGAAPSPLAQPAGLIPVPSGPLIGRTEELATVCELLRQEETRLLTLTGAGGAGKTRLALEVAHKVASSYAQGAAFVPLAPLRSAALVIPAILDALGLPDGDERPPLARLQAALRDRELLLVLDNCEHVVDAAIEIAALLATTPRLTILATSRALLHLAGEHTFLVPPLQLPDLHALPPIPELAQVASIALYLARVRERLPHFELSPGNGAAVAAICARLDGLPLAIELAAARAALLSPRMLLARLDFRLALLTDGPRDLPERQRTLRATIDWSYRLLDLSAQLLLARLAIFAGGWTLESAEAVSGAVGPLAAPVLDGLQALLDNHLLRQEDGAGGENRFTMLETVREFALERLTQSGEMFAVQQAHAHAFCALAEEAAPALFSGDQVLWFERLGEEHANLRVALSWLLAEADAPSALSLATSLHWFWFVRGHLGEGRQWLARALELLQRGDVEPPPAAIVARAWYGHGRLSVTLGDLNSGRASLELAVTLCRAGQDHSLRELLHDSLTVLIFTCVMQGDFAAADPLMAEYFALVPTLDLPRIHAWAALNMGRSYLRHEMDPPTAKGFLLQAEELFANLGDLWHRAQAQLDLGLVAMIEGDTESARGWFSTALDVAIALKDRALEAGARNNLGEVARLAGDDSAASLHYAESLRLHRELDSQADIPRLLHNLGYLALHCGDVVHAHRHFVASLRGFRAVGLSRGVAEAAVGLASLLASTRSGRHAVDAARLWGAAESLLAAGRATIWPADAAEHVRYKELARITAGDAAFAAAFSEGAGAGANTVRAESLASDALHLSAHLERTLLPPGPTQ